ncbi:hypothetical protein CTAYLR_009945 [Chrysophaeum taylorii]|uniref:UDENN domain-containing protein n=1 Tax=Chrysophaeum taylorii TaxID=2483200 RepID=A0AAD7UD50_9STRA|nr:hypothetical protein CTAYLR_009945 [Chrysophaeum taylorii]
MAAHELATREKADLKRWQRSRIRHLAASRVKKKIRTTTTKKKKKKTKASSSSVVVQPNPFFFERCWSPCSKRGSPAARVVVALATARSAVFAASCSAVRARRALEDCRQLRAPVVLGETVGDFSPQLAATKNPALSNSFPSSSCDRLYEHFLVIGLPSKLVEHPSVKVPARYTPRVLHHRSSRGEVLEAEAIADFCLPAGAGVRSSVVARKEIVEAVFVLSGNDDVRYGFCAHTTRTYASNNLEADRCYCLITRHPFALLHFEVLRAAIEADKDDAKRRRSDETMRAYAQLELPRPGDCVRFALHTGIIEWRRPRPEEARHESTAHIREWALPKMFERLALENVLLLLGCALVELQIVFVSKHLQTLSACALGLVSMLRPLRWVGPLVSALPAKMYEYLESPVPLVLGVVSLPLDFAQNADMVLVFADEDRVRLPPTLLELPGAHLSIQLPQLSQLAHDLSDDYAACRAIGNNPPPLDAVATAAVAQTPPSFDDAASAFEGSTEDDDDDDDDGDLPCSDDCRNAATRGNCLNASEDPPPPPPPEMTTARLLPPDSVVSVATIADKVAHYLDTLLSTACELRAERTVLARTSSSSIVRPTLRCAIGGGPRNGSSDDASSSSSDDHVVSHHHHPSAALVRTSLSLCDAVKAGCLSPSATARNEWWYVNLGDAGISFIGRFVETQMFSNYYFGRKHDEREADRDASSALMGLILAGGLAGLAPTAADDCGEEDKVDSACNGRCEGRLDTPQCTLLCAQLWEERHRAERRASGGSDDDALARLWLDPRRVETARHPAETADQFAKRRLLLAQAALPPSPPPATSFSFSMPADTHGKPRAADRAAAALVGDHRAVVATNKKRRKRRQAEIAVRSMRRVNKQARARNDRRDVAATNIIFWWLGVRRRLRSADHAAIIIQAAMRRRLSRRMEPHDNSDGECRLRRRRSADCFHRSGDSCRSDEAELMKAEDELLERRRSRRLSIKRPVVLETWYEDADDDEDIDDDGVQTNDVPVVDAQTSDVAAVEDDTSLIKGRTSLTSAPESLSSPLPLEQQQALGYADLEFRAVLRAGVVCVKHSRFGKPHKRLLKCNHDLSEIAWSRTDSDRKSCLGFLLSRLARKKRTVKLHHVTRVCGDASTANSKRAISRGVLSTPHAKTVSLVYGHKNQSLDLEFATAKQHRTILHGFQSLICPVPV